jgi:predicted transcriptional regulator YheO
VKRGVDIVRINCAHDEASASQHGYSTIYNCHTKDKLVDYILWLSVTQCRNFHKMSTMDSMISSKKITPPGGKEESSRAREENILILREARKIVEGFGKMLAPFCEIILYDLTQKDNSVVAIECPISKHQVGCPTSDVGLARIQDPSFPDILQNYSTMFPDGRPAKCTSIGLRNSEGTFVAAICIQFDISVFSSLNRSLEKFLVLDGTPHLDDFRNQAMTNIASACELFAAKRNKKPKDLIQRERIDLIKILNDNGILKFQKGAVKILADCLGITREYVYKILRSI